LPLEEVFVVFVEVEWVEPVGVVQIVVVLV
jgi:hypothetical protein